MSGVSTVYIRKFDRKVEQYNRHGPLPGYFGPMIGDRKYVRVAEVGAGPVNTIGDEWPGVEVEVIASDVLWPEYSKLWRQHGQKPVVPIHEADMERLPYEDNSFDIVHCRNAIDHTKDAMAAINEMIRTCKVGGWVYLAHAPDQKRRFGGHHCFDAKYLDVDPPTCAFLGEDSQVHLNANTGWKVSQEEDLITAVWQKT